MHPLINRAFPPERQCSLHVTFRWLSEWSCCYSQQEWGRKGLEKGFSHSLTHTGLTDNWANMAKRSMNDVQGCGIEGFASREEMEYIFQTEFGCSMRKRGGSEKWCGLLKNTWKCVSVTFETKKGKEHLITFYFMRKKKILFHSSLSLISVRVNSVISHSHALKLETSDCADIFTQTEKKWGREARGQIFIKG